MKQVEEFKALDAAHQQHCDRSRVLNAIKTVAESEGNEEAKTKAEQDASEHSKTWYETYKARKDAAHALCAALDIAPERLKGAL